MGKLLGAFQEFFRSGFGLRIREDARDATDEERQQAKQRLIRRLYARGYGRDDIMRLFRFIDWLLVLPANLELETRRLIRDLEGASTMSYVTSIERLAKEEGRQEGWREGWKEGWRGGWIEGGQEEPKEGWQGGGQEGREGWQKGLTEGLLEAIELGLELRFGKAALQVSPRLRDTVDPSRLRELKSALTRVESVAEFEALLGGP